MLHTLSERIADFLFDNNDDYPVDVYVYGIELTISSIIGALVLLSAGLILNCFIESIIYMISLSVIRIFSGGYHSKTYFRCNAVLIISYICSILFYRIYINHLLENNIIIFGIILIFSLCIFILFAPMSNPNKEILDVDKNRFKIISLFLLIAELSLSYLIYELIGIYQVLIVLPTIVVIDISILVEIIIQKRRVQNEKVKKFIKKSS